MASCPHYQTPTKASLANRMRSRLDIPSDSRHDLSSLQAVCNPDAMKTKTPTVTKSRTTLSGGSSRKGSTKSPRLPSLETPTRSIREKTRIQPKSPTAPKHLYLIRHGQSQGQVAKKLGMDRQRDSRLRDASLTNEGIRQAQRLALYDFVEGPPELIVSSPLTRALHTALLAFSPTMSQQQQRILVHYDLAEVGSRVPENTPRPMRQVLKDLNVSENVVDTQTLLPKHDDWSTTSTLGYDGAINRGKAIRRAMHYLYHERPEQVIAVVCHYNVIRCILDDGGKTSPQNAEPIHCELHSNGQVKQMVYRKANKDDEEDNSLA